MVLGCGSENVSRRILRFSFRGIESGNEKNSWRAGSLSGRVCASALFLQASADIFFPLFHAGLPLSDADIFLHVSSESLTPFLGEGLPFLLSDSSRRYSGFWHRFLAASDCFRRVSSDGLTPLFQAGVFLANVLPFILSDCSWRRSGLCCHVFFILSDFC